MGKDDAMVSKDILDIFGINKGEQIRIKYDFLSFLPPTFNEAQTILFDYYPSNPEMPSKGEKLLIYFGLDPKMTYGDLKKEINKMSNQEINYLLIELEIAFDIKEDTYVSVILNIIINHLRRDDFILKKDYVVLEVSTF